MTTTPRHSDLIKAHWHPDAIEVALKDSIAHAFTKDGRVLLTCNKVPGGFRVLVDSGGSQYCHAKSVDSRREGKLLVCRLYHGELSRELLAELGFEYLR